MLTDDTEIFVAEHASYGHGGVLWDGAFALVAWLQAHLRASSSEPLRCIELGAGCGFPGLFCAKHGHAVILTDLPPYVPLLALNAMQNQCYAENWESWGPGCAAAHVFEFGCSPKRWPREFRLGFDLVLISDVVGVGDASLYDGLIKSLNDLLKVARRESTQSPVVLLSYKPRAEFEQLFWKGIQDSWTSHLVDSMLPHDSDTREGLRAEVEIHLLIPAIDQQWGRKPFHPTIQRWVRDSARPQLPSVCPRAIPRLLRSCTPVGPLQEGCTPAHSADHSTAEDTAAAVKPQAPVATLQTADSLPVQHVESVTDEGASCEPCSSRGADDKLDKPSGAACSDGSALVSAQVLLTPGHDCQVSAKRKRSPS